MAGQAAGIAMLSFIVAVAVSIGYYQFKYIPEVNAKPYVPPNVLHPATQLKVSIVSGASLDAQPRHYVPKEVTGAYGDSNTIIWTNNDTVPHTVTSDDGYVDKINGSFNTVDQQDSVQGGYIMPGKTFQFTFTHTGEYAYHCIPHPFMTGKVTISESFA